MTQRTNTNRTGRVLFWLATLFSALVFTAAQPTFGQQCTGNPTVGCTRAGAPCSPVVSGTGSSGKCVTPGGYPPGERSCVCAGTPVVVNPPLNPNCSNPTIKGTMQCTINEPVVTQHTTGYQVLFAPGDHIVATAGGCVQTGGKGLTWKRYVKPSGPTVTSSITELIQFPGAGLVRIGTVIGQTITVTTYGALTLGYEDDGYSDNGYYRRDNGTGDQCKNVGPAQITISITC